MVQKRPIVFNGFLTKAKFLAFIYLCTDLKNKKKIIVTGGAGYIGSHTIIELLKNISFEIISIDNYSNSSAKAYDRIKKITGKKIKNYNVNLCDLKEVKKIFKANPGITGVIHFAAFKSVPESVENPLSYYHNNISSLVNILKCTEEFKVAHFIFSSSCSVYGNIDKLPVKEDTPLKKAESPYGYTKQIGEVMIKDFSITNPKTNFIVLRYFNPVGAHLSGLIGESPINRPTSLVPIITQTASGKIKKLSVHGKNYGTRDGTCIRDYVHVSDIADAHVCALESSISKKHKENYDIFNLGTGKGVTVLEAIRSFEKISGKKLNYELGKRREGDVEAIYSDCAKVAKKLNWKAKYNIDQMMESAWKWELDQR